jgi:hypothetical protein
LILKNILCGSGKQQEAVVGRNSAVFFTKIFTKILAKKPLTTSTKPPPLHGRVRHRS